LRCFGFLSSDRDYAHCSREEYADALPLEEGSRTYAHRLTGDCRCGVRHDPSAEDRSPRNGHKPKIAKTYDYTDAHGRRLYQVVRMEPKDFYVRRPDGHGGWINNLDGVSPVPYRLPEVMEAVAQGKLICLAEGEGDVETLRRHGYTATCNHGGAQKWRDHHSQALQGAADVVIFGDNDATGRAHVAQVCQSLQEGGGIVGPDEGLVPLL
jgi:hypothetical protein